ncbi:hypothetical protein [Yeosuana sp.]|tara:strand:+ start:2125 stop:2262 length:138 start_codon:yes stop_codon:yes gene_type:complete
MSPHYCKVGKIIPCVETEFESNNEINFSTEVIEKSNDENQNEELL